MGSGTPADEIFQWCKVVGSSIAQDPGTGKNEGLLYNVAGVQSIDFELSEPGILAIGDAVETDEQSEVFGQLGFLARPLPPDTSGGELRHAEALCLRSGDALTPIAYRDTRLKMQGSGPAEGTMAMIGYGGGFLSMSPVNSGDDGTIQVLYCPYAFDSSGVAQKAHSIILDPTSENESVSVIHSSGAAITMKENTNPLKGTELVLKNEDGSATLTLNKEGITITGNVNVGGNLVVGNGSQLIVGSPITAAALAASPSVLACARIRYDSP